MPAGCLPDYVVQSHAALSKAGDKLTGRYYQASGLDATQASASAAAAATTASNAADARAAVEAERAARLAELERKVAADPGNEELWLLFALQHIDFGAIESMQGRSFCLIEPHDGHVSAANLPCPKSVSPHSP